MIPLSLSRQTIGRSPALRLTTRVAVLLQQDGGLRGRSRSFSSSSSTTPTLLPPVLLPPSPPQPQVPLNERGIVGKVMNRYSIKESQSRIRVAESFFQAATRQGADPYAHNDAVSLARKLFLAVSHVYNIVFSLLVCGLDPDVYPETFAIDMLS